MRGQVDTELWADLLRVEAGAAVTRNAPAPPAMGAAYCPPQWSADGQRLASVRTLRGPTDDDPEIGPVITPDLAGGDERVVFTFPRLIPNRAAVVRLLLAPAASMKRGPWRT